MKRKIVSFLLVLVISICLFGCEKKNNEILKPKDTEERETDLELYSDDTKLVFDENSKIVVFYYKGDKITGMKQYLNEGKSITAQKVADMYNSKDKDSGVKEVKAEGKYVVIVYDETVYGELTVTNVRKIYTKEIKK